jgi:uncharacterized surface protein with fasciclin (FAS1) repeats
MKRNIQNTLFILGLFIGLGSCKNAMDEHIEVVNADNTINLTQKIAEQANLSKFNDFIKSTGYDQLLTSSQSYTVWAPTNDALATLDASITADPIKLKDFVANHIALTTIAASKSNTDTIKVNLINGKFVTVVGANFEEAGVVGAGKFVKNGALFVIDKPVPTKKNVWEYLLSSTDAPSQTAFINSLNVMVIDTPNATIIGYNAAGNPIFAPNPPMVSRNMYWSSVADLRAENQQFTYFMLQDAPYASEVGKLTPYYTTLNQFALVRDFTVKGLYTIDKLPNELLSTRGVKIPINKLAIVKSYKASNGMVYVMSALPFALTEKVPSFKIEGEKPFLFRSDKTNFTFYRTKLDNTGIAYNDIEVYNHGTSDYYVEYRVATLPFVKYKVYARTISGGPGDAQVATFTQRYFIYNPLTLVYDLFATQAVAPLTYNEVLLGEFTPKQFGNLQLRLMSASSTSINVNTLILDYLRFEPVLP